MIRPARQHMRFGRNSVSPMAASPVFREERRYWSWYAAVPKKGPRL